MELRINQRTYPIAEAWRGESLLHALREALGLQGAKFGCGVGLCGACTVLVDGESARSCTMTVESAVGKSLSTIEGLAQSDGSLHPVQQAWLDESVAQCGYCQAGQIMATVALLRKTPTPSDADIERMLSAQLCRCGTYDRIRRAVRRASESSQ